MKVVQSCKNVGWPDLSGYRASAYYFYLNSIIDYLRLLRLSSDKVSDLIDRPLQRTPEAGLMASVLMWLVVQCHHNPNCDSGERYCDGQVMGKGTLCP